MPVELIEKISACRRRHTDEPPSLYEPQAKRMSLDAPKKSISFDWETEEDKKAKEKDMAMRVKYDPNIVTALEHLNAFGKIKSKIDGCLERYLSVMSGAALLKLGFQIQEIFRYGDDLFRKRCIVERANPDGKPNEMTWRQYYSKFYFEKMKCEHRKSYEWESKFRTLMAVSKVNGSIKEREETRARILDTEIPKVDRTERMERDPKHEATFAKSHAVWVLPTRDTPPELAVVQKSKPEVKVEVVAEAPKVAFVPTTNCQRWHLKNRAREEAEKARRAEEERKKLEQQKENRSKAAKKAAATRKNKQLLEALQRH